MHELLNKAFADFCEDYQFISRAESSNQAIDNMYCFGFSESKRTSFSADDLLLFIDKIKQFALDLSSDDAYFYCWIDGMTDELRMSVVADDHPLSQFRRTAIEVGAHKLSAAFVADPIETGLDQPEGLWVHVEQKRRAQKR